MEHNISKLIECNYKKIITMNQLDECFNYKSLICNNNDNSNNYNTILLKDIITVVEQDNDNIFVLNIFKNGTTNVQRKINNSTKDTIILSLTDSNIYKLLDLSTFLNNNSLLFEKYFDKNRELNKELIKDFEISIPVRPNIVKMLMTYVEKKQIIRKRKRNE
jgi:hypothetical protein